MTVDFPDPEAPTIAVNFPEGMENETSFRTVTKVSEIEMVNNLLDAMGTRN
jgi:hypothetical protein